MCINHISMGDNGNIAERKCNTTGKPKAYFIILISLHFIHSFIHMVAPSKDRIVEFARKNTHNPKTSLYRLRKLSSRPRAPMKENNMSLRPIEIVQKMNPINQRNVPILVVTTSKKVEKGKPTAQNNKSLRPIEIAQKMNPIHQRNVPIRVVTTSEKVEKGKPTAQQIVSPLSLSSCDSNSSMKTCCNMLKRVRFADAAQVYIVVSYRKSLSNVEKARIWWTVSELHEFKKKNLKRKI
jgi:hypothetical protein